MGDLEWILFRVLGLSGMSALVAVVGVRCLRPGGLSVRRMVGKFLRLSSGLTLGTLGVLGFCQALAWVFWGLR